jgi:hypothetical protein
MLRKMALRTTTTPPRILPLLPIALVGGWVGQLAVSLAEAVLIVTGIERIEPGDDVDRLGVALGAIPLLVLIVLLSVALRRLVRWWVDHNPPRPGTRILRD